MLQYITNTSIIWLACLLLYEVWLRKESFHQFNRIYLLGGLVAGLLIPLVNFDGMLPASHPTFLKPSSQVYEIKKAMQLRQVEELPVSIQSSENVVGIIFTAIYFTGFLIMLIVMVVEVITLIRLYRKGSKSREQGCVVVETGKEHGAFSFRKIIFIRSRQDYNPSQWSLLLRHEKEHGRQLHLFDNLLLISLRMIYWFHPLSYIYFRKLRIVHEFQADQAAAAADTADYGVFLLEQQLLQGAPSLAHSFNYSPIKTRITMLTTKKSNRSKLLKYLTVLPLFLILIIFCTQTSFSGVISKKKDKVKFKQNEIEFGEFKVVPYEHLEAMQRQKKMFLNVYIPDSFPVIDRANGELLRMEPTISDRMPIEMNGKAIYGNEKQYLLSGDDQKYIPPSFNKEGKNFDEYLFAKLNKNLDQLENGYYIFSLDRLVIDDRGSIGYYEHPAVELYMGPDEKKPIIAEDVKKGIEQQLVDVLNEPLRFKPAFKEGKSVNARLTLGNYQIIVKDHKAVLADRGGC